jgi:hypothetical protein
LSQLRLIEASRASRVNVFDASGRVAQLGIFEQAVESAIVTRHVLGVNEHSKALVEAERGDFGILALGQEGLCHNDESKCLQFFYGWLIEHLDSFSWVQW